MKTTSFTLVLSLVFGLVSAGLAADQPKTKDTTPAKPKAVEKAKAKQPRARSAKERNEPVKETLATGSYIPQKVRRSGMIVDSPAQVQVIDRTMIETSGAADLKQLLIARGIH